MIKFKKKIIISIFLIFLFFNINIVKAEPEVLIDESTKDLRQFNFNWLDEEIEIDGLAELDEVSDTYDSLKENWNNADASEILSDSKYENNNHIDIEELVLEDVDNEIASMYFIVSGDLKNSEKNWVFVFWNDDEPTELFFITGNEDGDVSGFVTSETNTSGCLTSFHDEGTKVEITFDSTFWTGDDSQIYAMMITPEDDDLSDSNWIVDIYKNNEEVEVEVISFWFNVLIIVSVIVLISLVILTIYLLKRKNKNKKINIKSITNK